jgi:hypothetical protein
MKDRRKELTDKERVSEQLDNFERNGLQNPRPGKSLELDSFKEFLNALADVDLIIDDDEIEECYRDPPIRATEAEKKVLIERFNNGEGED